MPKPGEYWRFIVCASGEHMSHPDITGYFDPFRIEEGQNSAYYERLVSWVSCGCLVAAGPGSAPEPGIMEALSTARHDDGAGSPDAGEASGNDGRGRGQIARGATAGDLGADRELAREDRAESTLTDGDLAEGRFLGHKSSLCSKSNRSLDPTPIDSTKQVEKLTHWADHFHEHECPQCFRIWICGRKKCDPKHQRFCPSGELCHVAPDGSWKVTPKTIRKGRGVGPLFETRGIPVVSPYEKGDQGVVSEILKVKYES